MRKKDNGMVSILAFCGGIGSGKDTACEIAAEFGYDKIGFADHLKATVNSSQATTTHSAKPKTQKFSQELPDDEF